jgi:hypothetical protein
MRSRKERNILPSSNVVHDINGRLIRKIIEASIDQVRII